MRFGDLKDRKPFELYGYCLLNNHFHLLVRPQGDSISRIMQSLLVSHTQRYHKHRRSLGHVWQGRFKSPVVQNDEHLLTVLRYIEANPLRAKVVERAEQYRWSSYRVHGQGATSELVDRLITYEQLSPYATVRQRRWAEKVHLPRVGRDDGSDSPLERKRTAFWRNRLGAPAGTATGRRPYHPLARAPA